MLGSNIESLRLRPTFVRESAEAPVILSFALLSVKKSFLSTIGFDFPVPRGSKSVKREARSWLPDVLVAAPCKKKDMIPYLGDMLCVPVPVEGGQTPVAVVELSGQTFLEIDPSHQTFLSQAQMDPSLVAVKKYWACWSHQTYLKRNKA